MFFRKLSHRSRKKNEKYLTKSLLAHIKPVDIFSSEYLFVFSQEKSSFPRRLFTLIARELSLRDIPSIFLYQKDSISSRFSTLSINGYQISNSLNYGKAKGDIESNNLNGYYFDWKVDIENQTIEAYNTNFYPIILTVTVKLLLIIGALVLCVMRSININLTLYVAVIVEPTLCCCPWVVYLTGIQL